MKKWLKFFGLGYFSDKIAADAPKFGFTSVLLSILLALVFYLFGYYGADVAPFGNHYDSASQYKEFIHGAFADIELNIKDNTAESEKSINTYTDGDDRAAYSKNGYNLIVDTRPSDTLIKFTQAAVKGESEIGYEEYLALSETEKQSYTLETRYTDEELIITQEELAEYGEYLSSIDEAKEEYEALDGTAENYGEQLYCLYVKHYYQSVTSVLYGAKAPVLRDYYYANYIMKGNAYYFYIFDDMCAGSFETDGGIPVVFGGYFNKCADGQVTDIDGFIKDTFYDTASYTFTSYFIGTVSQLPMLVLIPIILGLVLWGVGKIKKDGWTNSFGGCYKTVNVFVWFSAFITALLVFIGSWFVSARSMFSMIPVIFGALLIIRIVIFCITSSLKNKKNPVNGSQNDKENDIFGGKL